MPLGAHAAAHFAGPTLVLVPFDTSAPPVRWGLTWSATGSTERVRAFVRAEEAGAADRPR